MLASFERLRMGNALMLIKETFRSRHRLELKYILGSICERFSKKCDHASLSAEILHNLLSLRAQSINFQYPCCDGARARRHITRPLLEVLPRVDMSTRDFGRQIHGE